MTLLIVGCGDVGLRVLRLRPTRWQVLATTSSPQRVPALRAAGAHPLVADLDRPETLARLAALADRVLMLAPPPAQGTRDTRSRHLAQALARGARVRQLVYVSTTGVYGDCGGALVPETRMPAPATARAQRRCDAEAVWRWYGRRSGTAVTILRAPGIYAADREGGDPRERVRRGSPALVPAQDVYTNHIHADDLARACLAALVRGPTQRAFNVNDDAAWPMGEYLDRVAAQAGLPPVPRLKREEAAAVMSPMQLSFLGESRRLVNTRMKRELRLALRYPTVLDGLAG